MSDLFAQTLQMVLNESFVKADSFNIYCGENRILK